MSETLQILCSGALWMLLGFVAGLVHADKEPKKETK